MRLTASDMQLCNIIEGDTLDNLSTILKWFDECETFVMDLRSEKLKAQSHPKTHQTKQAKQPSKQTNKQNKHTKQNKTTKQTNPQIKQTHKTKQQAQNVSHGVFFASLVGLTSVIVERSRKEIATQQKSRN